MEHYGRVKSPMPRPTHPGSLIAVGFRKKLSKKQQMESIQRANKRYGRGETNKKLAYLETVNKYKDPAFSQRLHELIIANGGS